MLSILFVFYGLLLGILNRLCINNPTYGSDKEFFLIFKHFLKIILKKKTGEMTFEKWQFLKKFPHLAKNLVTS